MLIDSHCHLDFDELKPLAPLLDACRAASIGALVVPGVSLEHLDRPLTLARRYPGIWPAAGFHPWHLPADRGAIVRLRDFARVHADELVAIGEAGLDKHKGPDLAEQQWWLEQQLALALELGKPVILHSVGTHAKLLPILRSFKGLRGVIHAFSGSAEQACEFVKLGFYLGVGGVITRDSAHKTRAALKAVAVEKLLLETDAPSMLPQGLPGPFNSPIHLRHIHKLLAELLEMEPSLLGQVLTTNTKQLFLSDETGQASRKTFL
ncbi:TatD family hydrolase [Gallaecimonas kandeliae]|uniref:TatD family hydrolase n=1 Tax=Gallaecimonas kandeliae TaxID=3029055 RepID=UPI002649F392|nr:TatD family hydrolase [Gallaecimonas kandeliae]WKE64936.1 TatD family hydrolase [Gallaecimonas kandeliae]